MVGEQMSLICSLCWPFMMQDGLILVGDFKMNEEEEITCQACKRKFPLNRILMHIAKSVCKDSFVSDEYNFVKEQVDEAKKAKADKSPRK